jgi:co-chaperonin GroES (HSP10)
MKAINYYVVVEKIKQPPKKVGGLELSESQNDEERYSKGVVISVGNLVEGIKATDIIRYDKRAGHGIIYDDKLYQVIKVGDIVIVE